MLVPLTATLTAKSACANIGAGKKAHRSLRDCGCSPFVMPCSLFWSWTITLNWRSLLLLRQQKSARKSTNCYQASRTQNDTSHASLDGNWLAGSRCRLVAVLLMPWHQLVLSVSVKNQFPAWSGLQTSTSSTDGAQVARNGHEDEFTHCPDND